MTSSLIISSKYKQQRFVSIYKKSVDVNKSFLVFFSLFLILWFLAIVAFLWRWQIQQYSYFKAQASNIIRKSERLSTRRGSIYTADGTVVALDKLTGRVYLSAIYKNDYDRMLKTLPDFLNYLVKKNVLTKDKASKILLEVQNKQSVSYLEITDAVPDFMFDDIKSFIKKHDVIGVFFQEYYKRVYPLNEHMASILGFVSQTRDSAKGLYGVEGYFWNDIRGREGKVIKNATKQGEIIMNGGHQLQQASEGKNIELTINLKIQEKVERLLAEGVNKYKAQAGAVIVMNPKTGEIIAMASYPTYNPNKYWQVKNYDVFQNKAVSYVYEYGSVQKPITIATALETKKIKKNFKCNDTGVLKVLDKKIYNWEYKHYGLLDLMHILRYSDNVCSGTIALKLTPEIFYRYLTSLGLGTEVNIGIAEEETGVLKDPSKWNKVDLAVAGFGQMVTATPLQVISAHSTIANNGVRMRPMLIKRVFDNKTSIDYHPVALGRIYSTDTASFVRKIMYEATQTVGYLGYLGREYKIAGKTGTAQIPKKNGPGYEEDQVNSTFVAFAPYDNPKMIMLVVLIKPQKNKLAAFCAVPLWRTIFNNIKDDLMLKPSY